MFSGNYHGSAYAYETVAVAATPIGPTASAMIASDQTTADTTLRAQSALVTVESNPIRYRIDGGNPVALGAGHPVAAGATFTVHGADNVSQLLMVADGTAGAARITYLHG